MERTFNAPRLKSQICLIGGNGFVCSSLNELNSNPLTFCSILFIVRILIRLTEVSGMNHMKYKTLIADRLGNSCLDIGFFYFTLTGSSRAVTHHLKEAGVFSTEINLVNVILHVTNRSEEPVSFSQKIL